MAKITLVCLNVVVSCNFQHILHTIVRNVSTYSYFTCIYTHDMTGYNCHSIENDVVVPLLWSNTDKGDGITYDGDTMECVRAKEGEDNHSMIFTTHPISKDSKDFYFEVRVEDEGENGWIGIGLAKSDAKYPNERMPGWDDGTIGYHGDDGGIYHNVDWKHQATCETFHSGDTVGCMMTRTVIDDDAYLLVSFTKNGERLKPTRYLEDGNYHPTIGMGSVGAKVTANLGETEFLYQFKGVYFNT